MKKHIVFIRVFFTLALMLSLAACGSTFKAVEVIPAGTEQCIMQARSKQQECFKQVEPDYQQCVRKAQDYNRVQGVYDTCMQWCDKKGYTTNYCMYQKCYRAKKYLDDVNLSIETVKECEEYYRGYCKGNYKSDFVKCGGEYKVTCLEDCKTEGNSQVVEDKPNGK